MKTKIGWILAIVFGLVILFFLSSLMMGRFWNYGGYGGMMGGFGYLNPFGYFGMALMWLISIALVVLLVLGIAVLVRGLIRPANPVQPAPGRTCSNFGKPAQANWTTCPYCGNSL